MATYTQLVTSIRTKKQQHYMQLVFKY